VVSPAAAGVMCRSIGASAWASLRCARNRPPTEAALLQDQPQSDTGRSRDSNGYHHG
jgi:hypothetical protein